MAWRGAKVKYAQQESAVAGKPADFKWKIYTYYKGRRDVVAVGKEEVSLLAELTEEQLTELPKTAAPIPAKQQFKEILEKIKGQK